VGTEVVDGGGPGGEEGAEVMVVVDDDDVTGAAVLFIKAAGTRDVRDIGLAIVIPNVREEVNDVDEIPNVELPDDVLVPATPRAVVLANL